MIKGIVLSWFGAYVRGIFRVLITALWLGIFPSMEEVAVGPGLWFAQILVINLTIMLCWAEGLHLFFYRYGEQGSFLQFSVNSMERHTKFTFGDQVWDNMVWSIAWGVPIWTF